MCHIDSGFVAAKDGLKGHQGFFRRLERFTPLVIMNQTIYRRRDPPSTYSVPIILGLLAGRKVQ